MRPFVLALTLLLCSCSTIDKSDSTISDVALQACLNRGGVTRILEIVHNQIEVGCVNGDQILFAKFSDGTYKEISLK